MCTLILTCACVLPAGAQPQTSTAGSPAKKSSATKSTASTAHKSTTQHHAAAKSGTTAKPSGSPHVTSAAHSSKRPSKKSKRTRGQQKIDSERARSIQEALIREHYLSGEPTGTWNQASEDAMRRYQSDHGWQTKEVPDSRALIKLGLGPSNDHLLNPESAMTTAPEGPRSPSQHPAQPLTPIRAPTSAQAPTPADPPSPQ